MNFKVTTKDLIHLLFALIVIVLIFGLFSLAACGSHKADITGTDLQKVEARAFVYRELINTDKESVIDARCDGLTFRSLGVYAGIKYPLLKQEYKSGQWHRDYKPCFSVGDSRSEISRDGFIMLFLALYNAKDLAAMNRIKAYGIKHNWIMGEGPKEYTDILILTPVLYEMIDHLSFNLAGNQEEHKSEDSLMKLDTFRGNLLAMYIWLRGLMNGEINTAEAIALEQLYNANKNNPIYSALNFKFLGGGDQSHTIELLEDKEVFPQEKLPGRVESFNWGDAPGSILFLVTLKILKHK